MTTIRTAERETYAAAHAMPQYAEFSPGEKFLDAFISMAQPSLGATVLDAGCSSGKGAIALSKAGFNVTCCDLDESGLVYEATLFPFVQACLWDDLVPSVGGHDFVYCCDVLEHIPTPFTMLVVSRLLAVAKHGVFLSIALQADDFGAWIGTSLHRTVQSYVAWRHQLGELGRVVEGRDLGTVGLYFVAAK